MGGKVLDAERSAVVVEDRVHLPGEQVAGAHVAVSHRDGGAGLGELRVAQGVHRRGRVGGTVEVDADIGVGDAQVLEIERGAGGGRVEIEGGVRVGSAGIAAAAADFLTEAVIIARGEPARFERGRKAIELGAGAGDVDLGGSGFGIFDYASAL